jgi:hypothetical protein
LIAQKEDVATVAAQMRHADPNTALKVYTQMMKHSDQGVAERLDEAIWGANVDSGSQNRSQDVGNDAFRRPGRESVWL